MKIPRIGLQIFAIIAKYGEHTSNAKIHNETGISHSIINSRLAYYAKLGIITMSGKQRSGVRSIKLTDKGCKWVLEGEQRKTFYETHGRLPKMPKRESPDTKQRKCLGPDCGEMFMSEWNGERICKGCKAQLSWRGSQCEDYMVRYG